MRNILAVKAKANAHYTCQECSATELIQAHHEIPGDDSSLVVLCADCHSRKHPDIPRTLFFNQNNQPYWFNKSASSLARELGVNSRTVIRTARKLQIAPGQLNPWDEQLLKANIPKLNPKSVTAERWMAVFSPRKMFVALECIQCGHQWRPMMSQYPWQCPACKAPDWDGTRMEVRRARRRIEDGVPYKSDTHLARKRLSRRARPSCLVFVPFLLSEVERLSEKGGELAVEK